LFRRKNGNFAVLFVCSLNFLILETGLNGRQIVIDGQVEDLGNVPAVFVPGLSGEREAEQPTADVFGSDLRHQSIAEPKFRLLQSLIQASSSTVADFVGVPSPYELFGRDIMGKRFKNTATTSIADLRIYWGRPHETEN
jgi:hypothetical protein